jgi:hypothetical protein
MSPNVKINLFLFGICVVLFLIFLLVAREERRRREAKQTRGEVDDLFTAEKEQRRYPRSPFQLTIPYHVDSSDSLPKLDSKSKNISQEGICLVTAEKLAKGSYITLDLPHGDHGKTQKVQGKTMWCCEITQESDQQRFFEVGIQFLNLSENNWGEIKNWVEAKSIRATLKSWVIFIGILGILSWSLPGTCEAGIFNKQRAKNKYFEKSDDYKDREKIRKKEIRQRVIEDMQVSARYREEREKSLREAVWFEKAEAALARKEFNEAYRYYQLLIQPMISRPLREKAQARIQEFEKNDILQKIIREEKRDRAIVQIQDADQVIRLNAIRELGMLQDVLASPTLVTCLKNKDPFTRRTAAWALGEINDPSGIEPLITALDDKEEWVQKQIHTSLVQISQQDLGPQIQPWVKWLNAQGSQQDQDSEETHQSNDLETPQS